MALQGLLFTLLPEKIESSNIPQKVYMCVYKLFCLGTKVLRQSAESVGTYNCTDKHTYVEP